MERVPMAQLYMTEREFRRYASLPSEQLTLEACMSGASMGKTDLMRIYFELQPMHPESLDTAMAQAIYRDRIDLLSAYADRCSPDSIERYFTMACAVYSQECADYLCYHPRLRLSQEARARWLKGHGDTEERHALVKSLSSQDWGPNDRLLRAINAEGADLDAALKPFRGADDADELYVLSLVYGCRDPALVFWAARMTGRPRELVLIDILTQGRNFLFGPALRKYGLPRNLDDIARVAALEGRIQPLRELASLPGPCAPRPRAQPQTQGDAGGAPLSLAGVLGDRGTWESCYARAVDYTRAACARFLGELGWALGHADGAEMGNLAWARGLREGAPASSHSPTRVRRRKAAASPES